MTEEIKLSIPFEALVDTIADLNPKEKRRLWALLAEYELRVAWMNAQSQSAAYQEWAGSDNDIYDQVFADADPMQ